MDTKHGRRLLIALVALASLSTALADDSECKGPSADCVAVGSWSFALSLGAGVRTNPVVHQSDIPLIVVPQFSYYGKRFFIDNLDAGVTLLDGGAATLSLVATPGYDRVFFYRSDLQNIFVGGFPTLSGQTPSGSGNSVESTQPAGRAQRFPARARAVTYLAGPEWTFKYHSISGQLDLLHEITGRDHGDEIRAALGMPLAALAHGPLSANIGITWKSAGIVNYYYGAPGIYDAGAVLDPFLKLAYVHPLGGKWKFTAFVECERLGNAIANSPIVNARYVTTTFVGTTYVF